MSRPRLRRALVVVPVAGLVLAGCGIHDPYNDNRGATVATTPPARTAPPPAPADPASPVTPPTPRAAVIHVAEMWGNWTSRNLHERHRSAIAATAGAAAKRLKTESRQLEDGVVSSPDPLRSVAKVEVVEIRGTGARRRAIVVTRERLEGLGELGSTRDWVVTLATVERHGAGWIVTRWERQR
jgi:hypothetical protein